MRAIMHLSPAQAYALPAAEFFALAWRLPAYPGVLAGIVAQRAAGTSVQAPGAPAGIDEVRRVPGTRLAIMSDPVLSRVVSFGNSHG